MKHKTKNIKHKKLKQTYEKKEQTTMTTMTTRPSRPRPRPFTENMTQLENKFDGLVKMALDTNPFIPSFEIGMKDVVRVAENSGVMIMAQKRNKDTMPRLPSEVWEFMLTEFGGINAEQHQHVPMMFLPRPMRAFTAAEIWGLYTTEMERFKERVANAEECRDIMKRYMHIM